MKTLLAIIILIFSIELYSNPIISPPRYGAHKIYIGIEAGTNYNVLSTSGFPFEIENNFSYNIGVNLISYFIPSQEIGLLINIDYLNRNHSFTNNIDNVSGEISYNTLQFRINYLYKILEYNNYNLSAFGGPVFGYLFNSEASNESGILLENDRSFEMLLNLGLKIEKQIHGRFVGIEYNYQTGLTNMNQNFKGITNNTHNLMLTFRTYL